MVMDKENRLHLAYCGSRNELKYLVLDEKDQTAEKVRPEVESHLPITENLQKPSAGGSENPSPAGDSRVVISLRSSVFLLYSKKFEGKYFAVSNLGGPATEI